MTGARRRALLAASWSAAFLAGSEPRHLAIRHRPPSSRRGATTGLTRRGGPGYAAPMDTTRPADAMPTYSHPQIVQVVTGVMLCILLAALDQTVIIPAVPAIAA